MVKSCIEFYEFYEELISEFNDKESNVKIINCDEKILSNLKKDWESLQLVRNYVLKKKKNGSNVNASNDNDNDNGNDKDNENAIITNNNENSA